MSSDSLDASIIVLFLDGSPWIGECVDAIKRNATEHLRYEIIVLANGVNDAAALPVHDDDVVRVLRTRVNLGFAGGCNWAARHARGRYNVLLNDDTEVEPGWLDALVSATGPSVGAVGSLIAGYDDVVEEAGRVLWRDGVGSAFMHGTRMADAGRGPTRSVDYCSAASLLVTREAWQQCGGFDTRYYPAYYEDADLCLELRRRGWRTLATTASRVRHRRSVSTSMLWRRFLGLRNHRVFTEKWADVLAGFPQRPHDDVSAVELERLGARS